MLNQYVKKNVVNVPTPIVSPVAQQARKTFLDSLLNQQSKPYLRLQNEAFKFILTLFNESSARVEVAINDHARQYRGYCDRHFQYTVFLKIWQNRDKFDLDPNRIRYLCYHLSAAKQFLSYENDLNRWLAETTLKAEPVEESKPIIVSNKTIHDDELFMDLDTPTNTDPIAEITNTYDDVKTIHNSNSYSYNDVDDIKINDVIADCKIDEYKDETKIDVEVNDAKIDAVIADLEDL